MGDKWACIVTNVASVESRDGGAPAVVHVQTEPAPTAISGVYCSVMALCGVGCSLNSRIRDGLMKPGLSDKQNACIFHSVVCCSL